MHLGLQFLMKGNELAFLRCLFQHYPKLYSCLLCSQRTAHFSAAISLYFYRKENCHVLEGINSSAS